jgi:hypothetical protein
MDVIKHFRYRNEGYHTRKYQIKLLEIFNTFCFFFFCSIWISLFILNLFNIHFFDLFVYCICHLLLSCFSSFNIGIIIRGVFILGSPSVCKLRCSISSFSSYRYYFIPIGNVYTYNRCSMMNFFSSSSSSLSFFIRFIFFYTYTEQVERTKERQTLV